jgi:MtN3 and saliva related transmembrane protein
VSAAAIVGYVAAACSVTGFLPQAIQIIKTRKTEDLSTPMYILQVVAFTGWVIYGVLLGELPIIIPNALCLILSAFILSMKLLPKPKRDAVADAVEDVLPDAITSGRSS